MERTKLLINFQFNKPKSNPQKQTKKTQDLPYKMLLFNIPPFKMIPYKIPLFKIPKLGKRGCGKPITTSA